MRRIQRMCVVRYHIRCHSTSILGSPVAQTYEGILGSTHGPTETVLDGSRLNHVLLHFLNILSISDSTLFKNVLPF